MGQTWSDMLVQSLREAGQRLLLFTPRLFAMLTLLVAGIVVGALARRVVVRLLRLARFDERAARWGLSLGGHAGPVHSLAVLVGELAFWGLFLLGLLLGVQTLEMPAATSLVALLLWFLPNLVVAGVILVVGWLLANFLSQAALIAAVNAQVTGAPLIAFAVRWLVLVFAGGAALTQLGIAREMVLLAFGIAFGGTVLALAVAFGLGAKELAREILESRLRKREDDQEPLSHL